MKSTTGTISESTLHHMREEAGKLHIRLPQSLYAMQTSATEYLVTDGESGDAFINAADASEAKSIYLMHIIEQHYPVHGQA